MYRTFIRKTERKIATAPTTHDSMGQCTFIYNLRVFFFFSSSQFIFHSLIVAKKVWALLIQSMCAIFSFQATITNGFQRQVHIQRTSSIDKTDSIVE